MTAEEWRPVEGFDGYMVSDQGCAMSLRGKAPLLMPGTPNRNGYLVVRMAGTTQYIHRLVALAFLGAPAEGQEVRHLDGDPANSAVGNLAWGSRSENMLDRSAHGRDPDANKTHCPQRHPYSPDNTYVRIRNGRPTRDCRTCRRERNTARAFRAAAIKAA